jgi:hypothetical protein
LDRRAADWTDRDGLTRRMMTRIQQKRVVQRGRLSKPKRFHTLDRRSTHGTLGKIFAVTNASTHVIARAEQSVLWQVHTNDAAVSQISFSVPKIPLILEMTDEKGKNLF